MLERQKTQFSTGNAVQSIKYNLSIKHGVLGGNAAYTVSTKCPLLWRRAVYGSNLRNLIPIAAQRHTSSVGQLVSFGSMNVHSLSPLKLDALLDEFRERTLDVMLLCET